MNRWTVRAAWLMPLVTVLASMSVHHARGAANAPIISFRKPITPAQKPSSSRLA